MDKTPIYPYPAAYARENGELEQYRASMKALAECKYAIDDAIYDYWDGMNFAKGSAKGVLKQFGPERVSFILAYTVREKNFDNRFSGHNASWAATVPLHGMAPGRGSCTLESHPAKVDLFIDVAREGILELAQQQSEVRRSRTKKHETEGAKMDKTPIYKESFQYAYQHGEETQHIASHTANIGCAAAIEQAMADHYSDNRLNTVAAVQDVVRRFGYERTLYVLANTMQDMVEEHRVSRANKDWARTIPVAFESGKRDVSYLITQCHPGLLDMFVTAARHEYLLSLPLKREDIKAEAQKILTAARHEYLLSLPLKREDIKAEAQKILTAFQNAQEPNSPNKTHYMAQVSPDFLARAKTKDHDRLMAMLPFQSLTLSTLNGRKGTYALIRQDENRFQPLVLRRPSVRKQLQEQQPDAPKPPSPGRGKAKGPEL